MSAAHVLFNQRSGPRNSRGALEQAFAAASMPCVLIPLTRQTDLSQLIAQSPADTLFVAAGGDGTVNAVASALAASPFHRCFGVLPCGTLNHFARDLGLPLELESAVQVLAAGHTRTIDAGEVNGHLFLNNSSLGFYPGIVLERERLRKVGWNKWLSLAAASLHALLRFHHIHVALTLPSGEQIHRTTPFLFVGNNEYTMAGAAAGTRACLDHGRLYLYMAPGATRLSLLLLTLAILRRKAHEQPQYENLCVDQFTVELRRHRRRPVSLDGEVLRLRGPLCYRIRPAALEVVVPA